ncbi:RNA polymerase sigma-54 factor [Pacificimonas flava]|uniref:RNA polymerase sigma-54 factor n=2 Tax=Pacificimonas TaxID=1960290 RepID=A0A219B382_9SPHN|nr:MULTISPECIES: RNA polymerase factor sigma-54 [Pacificimonas]MBZ6378080.1 RNA polymerase factor sigma-54 [Pacificimonas aurantium]OWV32279.1 RNA polymerase sigma-54 factor [Pacificimonas flava]
MLGPRLDLKQSQQLVMTPQLQQAIKLLALSNVELEAVVQAEVEKNPLLDMPEQAAEPQEAGMDGRTDGADGGEPAGADDLIGSGAGESDAPLDVDYGAETFHHDGPTDGIGETPAAAEQLSLNGTGIGGEEGVDPGAIGSAPRSLRDVLEEQAGVLSHDQQVVAHTIVDLIDEAGYFTGDCGEIAERLGAPPEFVEDVLAKVQTFEPTGVGARTLSECIAIQAREADRYDPAMATLIDRLDLVARGDLQALQRLCRVDAEDMSDMLSELRRYDPKPGYAFGGQGDISPVVPDIFVRPDDEGGWAIELNQATLPRLLVNREYAASLSAQGKQSKETKAFLSDCLQSANWLMNALDQRQRTIVRVTSELVKQQDGFFRRGISALKPLTLRAVAEEIEMHESTVSRVTSNKYLSCERGLFELKYFFTSAIQTSEGEDVSAEAVKSRIGALIAAESPKKVLSDDKLVTILKGEGFDIARRTVAKYREAMGIGSSVQRRRSYKLDSAVNA